MNYNGKSVEQVHAEGARRRRLDTIRDELHRRDLRRWNIGMAIAGAVFATGFSVVFPLCPLYGLYGAAAGWCISKYDLHTFGGLFCYGGGHVLIASLSMAVGLQGPHVLMTLLWLSMLVIGGILGLLVQLREWRLARALAMVDDIDVVVHYGSNPPGPRESRTPELHPDIKRPGHVTPRPIADAAIPFEAGCDIKDDDEADPAADQAPLPDIIDDEGFRPPG